MSSLMDMPIAWLHATKPAAIFNDKAELISGSLKRAPIGISSSLAMGRSGINL